MNLEIAAKQMEALGNATRLNIFRVLIEYGHDGCSVGEIQQQLSIPASTLSHHIAKLVNANLIVQERDSRSLICKASYDNMDRLLDFIQCNCCIKSKKHLTNC